MEFVIYNHILEDIYGCEETVIIPEGVEYIYDRVFEERYKLKKIVFPSSIKLIGAWAFYNCFNLEEIIFSSNLLLIKEYAFRGCISIKEINIPEGVDCIGVAAFRGCSNLEKVHLPDSLKEIESSAFDKCINVKEINIPKAVNSIGEEAFNGISLSNISVDENNQTFKKINNCLINVKQKKLIYGCADSIIPEDGSVFAIGDYAFCDCIDLEKIHLPNSIISIGIGAFRGCSTLNEINITKSINYIGFNAFRKCSNLKLNKTIKATNDYMMCRGYQFKLNEWSDKINGISICKKGYHFVENPFEIFEYYCGVIGKDVRFFEVETEDVSEERDENSSKRVCKRVMLTKEIMSYADLLK